MKSNEEACELIVEAIRVTELAIAAIAVDLLNRINRMLDLGRPNSVRTA